ncbi:hypothetical protein CJ030_MR5G009632 [Morella rubra]|uniref:Uncharacterized protein n=1 Tax=Morella rubra TaxID=262757 RepID=A0A6A1VKM3_9ROSI|nr:hypothetical protein CJ030_MR5G009632 [Morella rubra]
MNKMSSLVLDPEQFEFSTTNRVVLDSEQFELLTPNSLILDPEQFELLTPNSLVLDPEQFELSTSSSLALDPEQFETWTPGIRGYEPQWYLKDPPASPVPRIEDFGLVDVDPALLHVVLPPPAVPVEGNGNNEIIDLTSDTESEID